MVKLKQQRRRNRRLPDAAVPSQYAYTSVVSVHFTSATTVTVTFGGPVMIDNDNLPASWMFGTGDFEVVSAAASSQTVYVLTVAGTVASTQVYTMPSDNAVRTPSGGYVAGSSGTIAA